MKEYIAANGRYETMEYRRCGLSGLLLPAISLGLWHNFGSVDSYDVYSRTAFTAFDHGITYFDLANNYGPEPGSAEANFGRILREGLGRYRDELIISTKAGHIMWPGPYGEWGSRKHLFASLDQSLMRMKLDYVDIFYSHRPDPSTPLEETMSALSDIVRAGKALYVGISKYSPEQTEKAVALLRAGGTPCIVHQDRYSMLERGPENGLLDVLDREGAGFVAFSPLAQGMLTDRYLKGVPKSSRVAKGVGFLKQEDLTAERMRVIRGLNEISMQRGQSLAQMAIAWLLRDPRVTSVLIGASSSEQLRQNLGALKNRELSYLELEQINGILAGTNS